MPVDATGPSWSLFPNGLLVFARPAHPESPARLLLSRIDFCTAEKCACRDAGLRSVECDVDVFRESPPENLGTLFARGTAMESRIDIDLGTVTPDACEDRLPLSAQWAAFLVDEVDGQLLDRFHDEWRQAKGLQPQRPDFRQYDSDPELLVGWRATHLHLRDDAYLVDGREYFADELYCLKPGCDCGQAVIDFVALHDEVSGTPKSTGGIRVRLVDTHVLQSEAEPGNEALVEKLWAAFRKRHRDPERLVRHQKALLAAREADLASRAAPRRARAGRNEPCPCGSGQKYKRCCMDGDVGTRA